MKTYKNIYDEGELKIFLDLSTYCNSKCPQCHRTNPKGLGKRDWIPLTQTTIKEFKTQFPKETMKKVLIFHICGTWGDAIACKDIFNIIRYIKNNSNARIAFSTNGSLHNEEWWKSLGRVCGERLTVTFAIGGITQEMHSHYRQNTNLQQILNNMRALVSGGSVAASQTIIFDHNKDYLYEIEKKSKEYGCTNNSFIESNRFENGTTEFEFITSTGQHKVLKKVSDDYDYEKTNGPMKIVNTKSRFNRDG